MDQLQTFALIALIVYFAILLLAVTKEKKNHNVLDYFFAGRTLPFWALSITFIASWWGAGSALSTADLAYTDGLGAFWYYGVPVLVSTLLMVIGAKTIRRVGLLTQGQMFASRYSKITAKTLAVLILIFMVFNAASQMVGIGLFFGTYLGFSYESAVLLGTVIVLIYSFFGGFRGVVLTDLIQFGLLVMSAVIVFYVALDQAGGFTAIVDKAQSLNKDTYFDFGSGANKYLAYVVTFGASWMIQANVWQRISASKNDQDAYKMTVMSLFAYIPLYLIVVFTGMAGLVLFDTIPQGGVVTAIVMQYISPILGALVFVGISAAIMSTMDSLINTAAMTLALDLYPQSKKSDQESKRLQFSRIATLVVTIIALIVALNHRSFLDVTWMASEVITAGAFVPLIAGFIWRRGNSKGALCSMIFGFIFCFYNMFITFGVDLPSFWEQQSPMQVILGVGISSLIYVSVSLLTKPEYDKADLFIKASKKGNLPSNLVLN